MSIEPARRQFQARDGLPAEPGPKWSPDLGRAGGLPTLAADGPGQLNGPPVTRWLQGRV